MHGLFPCTFVALTNLTALPKLLPGYLPRQALSQVPSVYPHTPVRCPDRVPYTSSFHLHIAKVPRAHKLAISLTPFYCQQKPCIPFLLASSNSPLACLCSFRKSSVNLHFRLAFFPCKRHSICMLPSTSFLYPSPHIVVSYRQAPSVAPT